MAFDEGLAERIRGVLQDERGVTEKKMFGGLAFMLDGKMCCGVMKDELLVRVSDTAAALATPHTRPMTFTGKPFKGFVLVTADGLDAERDLERWVLGGAAVAHTLTTPAKNTPSRPAKEALKQTTALNEKLVEACIVGHAKKAAALLKAGADPKYRTPEDGLTAFHCAARGGFLPLAKKLLAAGADVHTRDHRGCTPLFDLIEEANDLAMVKFLLDRGASVDAVNDDGWTPLMAACTWDDRWNKVAALLIKRGANVNHIARDDWSPLLLAFHENSEGGVHTVLLKAKELNVNLVTPHYGWTPLLHAAAGSNLEAVRTLLARGARVNARMKVSAGKPFTSKASMCATNVAAAIRAKPEHDGFTALDWAVMKRRRCQPLLLAAGAKSGFSAKPR